MINPSGNGTGSILGKPRTGLPVTVVYRGRHINIYNDPNNPVGNHVDDNVAHVAWEVSIRYPNVVGFFDDSTGQLWVWMDCNRRWWTPDLTNYQVVPNTSPNTNVTGVIPINTRLSNNQLGGGFGLDPAGGVVQYINGGVVTQQTNVPNGSSRGVVWNTWDSITGSWISKINLCDQTNTPNPSIPTTPLPMGKVYTRIATGDKLPRGVELKTYGIWSDNVGNLTTFYTASLSGSVQPFHQTVHNKAYGTCGSTSQFDVAYGNDAGSGSVDLGGYDWMTPTNATYGQYRLLCLGRDETKFKIGSRELDHVYIINIKQARMQERIDEGNVELNLAHLSGSEYIAGGGIANAYTGSNITLGTGQVLRLIDDSRIDFDLLSTAALTGSYIEQANVKAHRTGHGGSVYYMVSGSIEKGIHNETMPNVYGLLYPQLGVIVLDAELMNTSASFGTVTGSDVAGDNAMKLFTAISGAAQYTDLSGDTLGFQARRKETEFAEYYFVRVMNADYNYSNNPTFQSGSEGNIISDFNEDPTVYFSTIGLYNEQRECIAVGKVTRPIQKTCTSEALFKIRLKY